MQWKPPTWYAFHSILNVITLREVFIKNLTNNWGALPFEDLLYSDKQEVESFYMSPTNSSSSSSTTPLTTNVIYSKVHKNDSILFSLASLYVWLQLVSTWFINGLDLWRLPSTLTAALLIPFKHLVPSRTTAENRKTTINLMREEKLIYYARDLIPSPT